MYFIRVNGDTSHNNPAEIDFFVSNEPPQFPSKYFNYLSKCLSGNFVRIGWPDVGDLHTRNKQGALAQGYDWHNIKEYVRGYLDSFFNIPVGSTIVVPDKDNPGDLYIGTTTSKYYFYHNIPNDPYECSHRIDVKWDTDEFGKHIIYSANSLGINIHGGWWMRAFHFIQNQTVIENIKNTRIS